MAREPCGELLRGVRSRLRATRSWIEESLRSDQPISPPPDAYLDASTLAEPLRLCHTSLVEQGNARIAAGRLADVLRRVAVFGVVLARLDIRQNRHAIRRRWTPSPRPSALAPTPSGMKTSA